jgi:oligosaccharyltransferase complex subunit alpha (ribophorin I)
MWLQRCAVAVAAVLFLACTAAAEAGLKIERFDRQVNLKNQFVVTIDAITLRNNGKAPMATFQWCMLEQHMPRLAYLSVSFEDQSAVPDWQTRLPKAVSGMPAGIVCIELPAAQGEGETLSTGQQSSLTVSAVYTKLQEPFPKSIAQKDPQRVTYKGNMYALSPHPIAVQTSKYEFSAEVLSHTQPTKGEKKSRSILYGPFADVAPLTLAPAEFHYVNNAPFAEAKTLERTFDIVWNTIHVEERYVVTHGGAKHAGEWSRHDQAMDPGRFAQSAFRELPADAPVTAKHLYFRDAIGNVSTSAVRKSLQQITVALLPRIPLYGGWSTDFVYGFEVPLRSFSGRAPDGRKELVYSFTPHVKGLVTHEQVIRVVLPEGAYDISVEVPFEVELTYEPKYTYLNKEGRTVVVLRAENVIDALSQPFAVRYRLRPLAWAREPALWGASLAAVLAALVLFANADFSLVHKGSAGSKVIGRVEADREGRAGSNGVQQHPRNTAADAQIQSASLGPQTGR